MLEVVGDWKLFLSDPGEEDANKIRGHERTGRALGEDTFFGLLEDNLQGPSSQGKWAARRNKINRYGLPVFLWIALVVILKEKGRHRENMRI